MMRGLGNYAWEYLDERERWRSFSPSSVAKLNEAFKNGSAASSVEISTVAFMADFENQTIINNSGSLKYKVSVFSLCVHCPWCCYVISAL